MSIIYLNDNFCEDVENIADKYSPFSYKGLGVFDSMLSVHGVPENLDYHIQRFKHDVETVLNTSVLGNVPDNLHELYNIILNKNNLLKDRARLRTTMVLKDNGETIFIIYAGDEAAQNTHPITCSIIKDYPRTAGELLENCKRLNYSKNFAARQKAQQAGADEAILINSDGNIACGATSNIFIEENGILITPPLSDGVLAGTTRRKIIKEREVIEDSISEPRLHAADKIYLTNSFFGMRHAKLI